MKLLITEDDFRIAEMYKEYLDRHLSGIEIYLARDARECLDLVEQEDIQLILLDVYLPDMLGDELMEKITKRYPYTDFIVITATQEGGKFKKLMQLGPLYYLVKPVKLEQLKEVVHDYQVKQEKLSETAEIDQTMVDEYFGKVIDNSHDALPKGIDPVTLQTIEDAFEVDGEWTSSRMGEYIGTSRTTVRRYLEYLKNVGKLSVKQDYGDKGRPEKIYRK
ncbi:response regulator [Salinicoccus albus]|uniref:response regulator n=1 Tax=Salinicoccus albus TaxID=418756 RepID=UPI000377D4D3|nr:response regulator [Salinicoccus albus]